MCARLMFLATLLACLASSPVKAQGLAEALKGFLHDDAVATLHVRSFYFDKTNPQWPNNVAWAGGGWVGYESGWLYDTLQAGAVGYTTSPSGHQRIPAARRY